MIKELELSYGESKKHAGADIIKRGEFEHGNKVKYWLDDVQCTGNEKSLFECPHRGLGVHNCGKKERAGVHCLSMLTVIL